MVMDQTYSKIGQSKYHKDELRAGTPRDKWPTFKDKAKNHTTYNAE